MRRLWKEKKGDCLSAPLISQGNKVKLRLFTKSTSKAITPLASPIRAYSLVLRLVRRIGSGLDEGPGRGDKPRVSLPAVPGQR